MPKKTSGLFSFEERMGCGFGACMGCSCKTKYGSKRICKDGPLNPRMAMGVFPAFSRAFARPYMGGVPTPPPIIVWQEEKQ